MNKKKYIRDYDELPPLKSVGDDEDYALALKSLGINKYAQSTQNNAHIKGRLTKGYTGTVSFYRNAKGERVKEINFHKCPGIQTMAMAIDPNKAQSPLERRFLEILQKQIQKEYPKFNTKIEDKPITPQPNANTESKSEFESDCDDVPPLDEVCMCLRKCVCTKKSKQEEFW